MKTAVIIQARMDSSRLPGKVMMKLDGKNTTLYYVITQLQSCKLVNQIIVATSDLKQDDIIAEFSKNMGISVFRGNEKNVLDRFYQCAKIFYTDIIIRIPADKPLIDPNLVDDAIQKFQENNVDYLSNWLEESIPGGTEIEIFSFNTLKKIWKKSITDYQKEHVTPYIYENKGEFKIVNLKYKKFSHNLKYSLDTKQDYDVIKKIISLIEQRPILTKDIHRILNQYF